MRKQILQLMLVISLALLTTPSFAQSDPFEITIEEATITMDAASWQVQDDVEDYYVVLNSAEGAFEDFTVNQTLPEDEAVIAISDQSQFVEQTGLRPIPSDIESLAEALEANFSFAIDQEPTEITIGGYDAFRMRVNFQVFHQYNYIIDIDGLRMIFYLYTEPIETDTPTFEAAIEALVNSASISGDISSMGSSETPVPDFFAHQMSNDLWVVHQGDAGWLTRQDVDHHDLKLEIENDDIGYILGIFQTPDVLGSNVFGRGSADAILSGAKEFNPPFEDTNEVTQAEQVSLGDHMPYVKRWVYDNQTLDFYLYEIDNKQLLVMVYYQNDHLDAQNVFVENVLAKLNQTDLLEAAVEYGVPSFTATSSTDAEFDRISMAVGQSSAVPILSFTSAGFTDIFSIRMNDGLDSTTYDFSTPAIYGNYLIEVKLGEEEEVAYANYVVNRSGELVIESDTYTASGTIEFTAEFEGFVDLYSRQPLEDPAEPNIDVPDSITFTAEFTNIPIENREYLE